MIDFSDFKPCDITHYMRYLYHYAHSLFEWELPDYIPAFVPEMLLIKHGTFGIFKRDDKIIIAAGNFTGAPTPYMPGDSYIGATLDGTTYTGKIGDDVAVVANNWTFSPTAPIIASYAARFAESDKSILNVIQGARITAIVTADTTVDKLTLDGVVRDIRNGEIITKIPPAYRDIDALDGSNRRFDVMRLTDPKDIEKLAYLNRYRDDLLAAYLTEIGIECQTVNKMAQVTSGELNYMAEAIAATTKETLEARQFMLDTVRKWGINVTVTNTRKERDLYDTENNAERNYPDNDTEHEVDS